MRSWGGVETGNEVTLLEASVPIDRSDAALLPDGRERGGSRGEETGKPGCGRDGKEPEGRRVTPRNRVSIRERNGTQQRADARHFPSLRVELDTSGLDDRGPFPDFRLEVRGKL